MKQTRQIRMGQSDAQGSGWILGIVVVGIVAYLLFSPGSPVAITKPVLPVVVSYRESLVGAGKVAIFINQSERRLTIACEFENQAKRQSKMTAIDLIPNGEQEVGWIEGGMFESGETIKMSHPEYTSRIIRIP